MAHGVRDIVAKSPKFQSGKGMATPPDKTAPQAADGPKRRGRKPTPVEKPTGEPGPDTYQAWLAWLIYAAGITQSDAATLIAKQTGRPCSPRSVRAWLADAALDSASPCPEWAVTALRRKLVATKKISG